MRSRLNLPTGAAPPPLPEEPLAPAPVLSLAPDSLRMKGRFLTAWNIREGTGEEEGEIGGGGWLGACPLLGAALTLAALVPPRLRCAGSLRSPRSPSGNSSVFIVGVVFDVNVVGTGKRANKGGGRGAVSNPSEPECVYAGCASDWVTSSFSDLERSV